MFPTTAREVSKDEGINNDIRRSTSIKLPVSREATPPVIDDTEIIEAALTSALVPGAGGLIRGRASFSEASPSSPSPTGQTTKDSVEKLSKLLRKTSLNGQSQAPSPMPEVSVPTTTPKHSRFQHLLPPSWQRLVLDWFHEDIPVFDYGGFVVGETEQVATLYGKNKAVLAGVPFFNEVFRLCDCKVEWFLNEGEYFEPIDGKPRVVAKVYGKARHLLMGERVALNMVARASGIATRAHRLAQIKARYGYKGVIAGTRKTTPGFRLVEKYAMLVGGADTHRMDLSSMIMLKDNHIWAQGSITSAVQLARQVGGFALKIEVECRTEEEADEAIAAGADIIMLDNFEPEEMKLAARRLKERWGARSFDQGGRQFLIEGSGGINENTVHLYFCPDIDVLSLGSLTQGVPIIDFSLKIDTGKPHYSKVKKTEEELLKEESERKEKKREERRKSILEAN